MSTTSALVKFWLSFNLFYLGVVFALITLGLPRIEWLELLLLPVFLTLLPLLNAALDWLSLGYTRGLLYAIQRRHHIGWVAAGWALLDIGLALLFLFMITSITALTLGGLNGMACYWADRPLLDLQLIFDGLSIEPFHLDYWWIHFIMLSTLIPTLVHFFVAAYATVLSVGPRFRNWIVDNIDQDKDARQAGFLYVSFASFLGLFGVALLGWLLFSLLDSHAGWIGGGLMTWAGSVAAVFDPGWSAVP